MGHVLSSYQKYQSRLIQCDGATYAKILSHDVASGAKHIEHLREAVEHPINKESNRFILVSDTVFAGYQAATILIQRFISADIEAEASDCYQAEESFDDDLEALAEIIEEFDEEEDKDESSYSSKLDILIGYAETFDLQSDEISIQNPMAVQRQMVMAGLIRKAENLLLHCSKGDQDKEQIIDNIINQLDISKNIFLLLPSDQVSNRFIEQMIFQYDFKLINIHEPSMQQLVNIFQELIKEKELQLEDNVDIEHIIRNLKSYRTNLFWEKDIERLVTKAKIKALGRKAAIDDFSLYYHNRMRLSGEEQLYRLIGQKEVKEAILRMTALAKLTRHQNEKYKDKIEFYHNYGFAGAPGTGKTVMARIVAQIFHENGLSNGVYMEVSKEDLVGGYLGQTNLKISKLLKRVSGGVLFIDEAGSLVTDDRDIYAKEAISALVRHMENNPSTTIILATYGDEMERLLNMDHGLKSRITRVVEFLSYSNDELWSILNHMASEQHISLEIAAKEEVLRYIEDCRKEEGESFGNAREMRKLLQAAKEELAMRCFSGRNSNDELLTANDIGKAVKGLSRKTQQVPMTIGFAIPS